MPVEFQTALPKESDVIEFVKSLAPERQAARESRELGGQPTAAAAAAAAAAATCARGLNSERLTGVRAEHRGSQPGFAGPAIKRTPAVESEGPGAHPGSAPCASRQAPPASPPPPPPPHPVCRFERRTAHPRRPAGPARHSSGPAAWGRGVPAAATLPPSKRPASCEPPASPQVEAGLPGARRADTAANLPHCFPKRSRTDADHTRGSPLLAEKDCILHAPSTETDNRKLSKSANEMLSVFS
ncbi:forkhead box protein L2-like [Schistocerca americana]|uniref:forkhead box protein L2-like n=1 Tax=Schistocerca americana TaxID=7009 RepID=UPI001F4F61C1|nr:forkhead box protein L2-like [Schistocerca americana]